MNALVLLLVGVLLAVVLVLATLPRLRKPRQITIPAEIAAKAAALMEGRRGFAPGMVMHGNAVLNRMEEERQRCVDYIDNLLQQVETEGRDLVDTERSSLRAQRERIAELDEQITDLRAFEDLREADQETTSRYVPTNPNPGGEQRGGEQRGTGLGARVTEREHEYRTAGEFIADGYRASARGDERATARLRSVGVLIQNGQMVRAEQLSEDRAAAPHNTTDEIPGLLPHTIVGQIMSDVDAARPFIGSIGAQDLGGIPGKTFERPTITQHVEVGKQATEKSTVANRQFEVEGVPFAKDTYGGWANVSRQTIDFSSPAAWNALMTDFVEQYGLTTENAAADAFATAITQEEELETALAGEPTLQEVLKALYGAAVKAYQGGGRLPDMIWASLDWWQTLGVIIDHLKATTAGDGGGDSDVKSFAGNLLRTPRVIVPSFPAGTLIVGVKSRTEVYEDRFGFLSAVEPKVLGVELAYGGYMASGTVKPAAFCKIVNEV